jgi:hypothetical protein
MKPKDDPNHATGASQAYQNVNRKLASALGIQRAHGRLLSEFELNAKRVEYQTERLKIYDNWTKESGKPIRHPRLDKTRKRPLQLP